MAARSRSARHAGCGSIATGTCGGSTAACGLPSELADIIIRTIDLAYTLGIDIDEAIVEKVVFNRSRERLHGKRL